MKPACTAACDQRVMLTITIEALAVSAAEPCGFCEERNLCPFLVGGPLYDTLHVDSTDPECYCRSGEFETALEACRECILDALEERACAKAAATEQPSEKGEGDE